MEKKISFSGKNIIYNIKGDGPVLVFLHGFLENYTVWDDLTEFLKQRFTCIAVDLPGFGKSDVYSENHTMPFMADAVKAVLNEEKVNSAVVTGHSMGGYVSLAFARKFSYMLKGLVLFHSHAAADDEQGKENRNRTIEVVKNDRKHFITNFIPLLFAEENIAKFGNEIAALKQVSLQTSAAGVIAALAGMRDREDYTGVMNRFDFPLFFVVGKQDSRITVDKIAPQLVLPGQSESIILDGVGHMGFIEAPEKIFPVLADFYNRCFSNKR